MANAAGIVAGPKGTPTQEFWDGFIGAIENCPDFGTLESNIKKLNGYIDRINKAIADGEKEIYDATIGKFNECKQEILDYLSGKQDEIQEQVEDLIEDKQEVIEAASNDLEEEIEDLTLNTTTMTAETAAGDEVKASPLAGSVADLYVWAGKVNAYIDAQKATTLAMIVEIKNKIKRIKKKSELIIQAVAWWPSTISKLITYMNKRIGRLAEIVTSIQAIKPPLFPYAGVL